MSAPIGKFTVSASLFRDCAHHDFLIAMQSGMAILKTEDNAMQDTVTLYATGPMFKDVGEGEATPEYQVTASVDTQGNKTFSFTWTKEL